MARAGSVVPSEHPVVQHQSLQPGCFHGNGKMLSLRCSLVPTAVAGDEVARLEHPSGAGGPSGWSVPRPAGPFGGFGRRARVTPCGGGSLPGPCNDGAATAQATRPPRLRRRGWGCGWGWEWRDPPPWGCSFVLGFHCRLLPEPFAHPRTAGAWPRWEDEDDGEAAPVPHRRLKSFIFIIFFLFARQHLCEGVKISAS